MSLSTVLKNIYTFSQILSQASTDAVSQWDEKSFNNAFNWARYCEQVYKNVKDKPLRENIERQLEEMTALLSPPSCLVLNVESLGKASEILQQKLLLNCNLKLEMLEKLIIQPTDQVTQKLHGLVSLVSSARLSQSILHLMKQNNRLTCNDIPVQSKLLFQHFMQQYQHVSKHERFCSYVSSMLTRTSNIKHGLVIIICVVAVYENRKREEEDSCHKINQLVFSWLDTLSHDQPHKLLQVEKKMLCEVSACSQDFLNMYTQTLVDWARHMKPDYHRKYFPKLYQWRSNKDCGSYEDLLEHFTTLSSAQPYLYNIVVDGLEKHIKLDKCMFSIWLDILKDIKSTSKT